LGHGVVDDLLVLKGSLVSIGELMALAVDAVWGWKVEMRILEVWLCAEGLRVYKGMDNRDKDECYRPVNTK
jgi:hypothetical protein